MEPLSRDQLVELVQRIRNFRGSDKQLSSLIEVLERNVPHPNVSNLIFWHAPELSSDEVIEQALKYRPLEL